MKLVKRVANHQRNAFDLSHRHLIGAKFGELLPITCIETVPGDYVELSIADLLRAAPMVTSPFLRAKQHIDVYYVPYCDIWTQFESFMTAKSEPKHANVNGSFAPPYANKFDLDTLRYAYSNTAKDAVGILAEFGADKLLDLLGYGRSDVSGSASTHPAVNLWRIAAYNKIWYEHYRQQYYDDGMNLLDDSDFVSGTANPAVLFNFDDMVCTNPIQANVNGVNASTVIQNGSGMTRLQAMLQMRYRLWKKDLFTGLLPSTQFGNVSAVMANSSSLLDEFRLYADKTQTSSEYLAVAQGSVGDYNPVSGQAAGTTIQGLHKFKVADTTGNFKSLSVSGGSSSLFNILDLRKAEALQIWREAALTAGNRIADNMRAHYGDDAEYIMHESQLIGSVSAPLNISDVNATAQIGSSTNQALGDVAGKGISSMDNQVIKFKAKKFGVIMVMFSLLPEAEYQSDGIDRMNQLLEREDYFVPEYMDLGLEPVSSIDFYNNPLSGTAILGYAPRYIGYKQKLDKCFGGFKKVNGVTQPFAAWASPKTDVITALASTPGTMPLACLYVNPHLFDVNFVSGASISEQFLCDFFFDCTKVSDMSVSSLPRF